MRFRSDVKNKREINHNIFMKVKYNLTNNALLGCVTIKLLISFYILSKI